MESGGANAARAPEVLRPGFYDRDVVRVARDLIGCVLHHQGASGVIVETEAYHETEPACHAFVGLTPRTAVLMGPPGTAYVYRSYGIHALLNAVCEADGVGAAVLIRALQPLSGVDAMAERRGFPRDRTRQLCSGPGKLTQALGISLILNGTSLATGPVTITARTPEWAHPPLASGRRIGITKAVDLPWRFAVAGTPFLSAPMRA